MTPDTSWQALARLQVRSSIEHFPPSFGVQNRHRVIEPLKLGFNVFLDSIVCREKADRELGDGVTGKRTTRPNRGVATREQTGRASGESGMFDAQSQAAKGGCILSGRPCSGEGGCQPGWHLAPGGLGC